MTDSTSSIAPTKNKSGIKADYREEVLNDFYLAILSREASLLGRKEVLTGKAKFGILGDGKELPQIAMGRAFRKGDWRSGYYRDQTFMMKIGQCSIEDYFAQLYADPKNDPFSGGRQMNNHFASPTYNQETGEWLDHTESYNNSADVSCTGGQMARALGLALASKSMKELEDFPQKENLTNNGNEIAFVTIGDASTSEGVFWETLNAAAVEQVPLLTAVWDDGYGISVPVEMQTVKGSISKAMSGFEVEDDDNGIRIFTVKGWDYPHLIHTFEKVAELVRTESRPALVHVTELTQPQGHSTSGSHERYKSGNRLQWEKDFDCNVKMEEWILQNEIATKSEIETIKEKAIADARQGKRDAWSNYYAPVKEKIANLQSIYDDIENKNGDIESLENDFKTLFTPTLGEIISNARKLKFVLSQNKISVPDGLSEMIEVAMADAEQNYHTHLYSEGPLAAINVPIIHPAYDDEPDMLNGYQIINKYFDTILEKHQNVIAFGEDVGQIGDVNQGFAGLQEKYGEHRVFDSGIREWSIMGMAIGTAMRGLRPIAEIQYLDYLLYGLSPLSDDLATLRYRSNGIQKAPAIIRTRGHRLEGIWHSGSPLGMMVNSLRGMYICCPRNMVQAAGMYNTLLHGDDPGIIIECLNGYRLKEAMPNNLGEYTVPLGVPEILKEGSDITLVTYGSCVREALDGIELLEKTGISVELIDVQTLLPFDLEKVIALSIAKTNKVIFMDEDVPNGATAYMMNIVLEKHGAFKYLDMAPKTITAYDHRPPFGSDGDYFSKPVGEDVYEAVYAMMKQYNPQRFA